MEASDALARAAQPGDTLQERIQAARHVRERQELTELPIPGYGGLLRGRFHVLGWKEQRALISANAQVKDEATQELYVAADSIVTACEGTYAHIDGEIHSLNLKIGVPLGVYLGLDMEGVDSERQALFVIVPDEMQIIETYFQLMKAWGTLASQIEDELGKNLEAVS